ncbi:GGDEF domain-containing protein [Psychromonas aquimarina]|uniref:GGDEF domain-containing protein n=1 Tax=Psychromonas aquimarina TaxID=444919 RepID=UPI00040CB0BB|nr:sensor domain-containing diguanylate cyclase [Psychromonas aquimarina]
MPIISSSLEQFNTLLIDMFKASKDGYAIFDPSRVLIFCNHRFSSSFGLSISQAEGLSFSELFSQLYASGGTLKIDSDDIAAFFRKSIEDIEGGGFRSFELHIEDGRWMKISRLINADNYVFLYGTEITKLKNTESELRQALIHVEKLAAADPLTGISNRRNFFELAEIEFERSLRYSLPLSLLALDIDHFKLINDNYGHQAGDQVLTALTVCCQQLLRSSDIFSRLGGEEFSILLPGTELEGAVTIAERILQEVAELSITYGEHVITLTTSIGIAELSDSSENLEQLMNQADEALYKAKEAGRNRIEVFLV